MGTLVVSHTGSVLYALSSNPGVLPDTIAPGYWITNLRVGVKTSDDKYEFSIVANNLFNEGYAVFGDSLASGVNLDWGLPRIIRGEVTMKF